MDFVFRPCLTDSTGAIVDDLGTYDSVLHTLTTGVANANFHVLYDSHNRLSAMQSFGLAPGSMPLPMAARAEAQRPLIKRVIGTLLYKPTTWALGSTYSLGLRFGIFEQDPSGGGALLDPSYTMWSPPVAAGANQLRAAVWANDRNWQHERREAVAFADNSQIRMQRFNFPVNRRIDPNEAYGVFMESSTLWGSVSLQYQWWLRSLVADEG